MTVAEAWTDLEDELLGEEPDYDSEPADLPDTASVNRMLGRLAHVRRRAATDAEVAHAQIDQVQAWATGRAEMHQRQEAWLLATLRRYHEAVLALGGTKTLDLPNGTLRARAGQPQWEIDAEAFVPWALALKADELLRVKIDPSKAAIKEAFEVGPLVSAVDGAPFDHHPALTPDGEIVPGITIAPAETNYSADTRGAE